VLTNLSVPVAEPPQVSQALPDLHPPWFILTHPPARCSAKFNTHGGAIAVGHPLGASGARIMGHLTHVMVQKKEKLSIGAACIGGGQGIAMLIENVA